VCVLKTTLGALNETLRDVEHNDKLMRKGLSDIQKYLDTLSSETAHKLSIFEAKFTIEKYITQVKNALTILQRNMDLLLHSVVHARTGASNHKLCRQICSWNPYMEVNRSSHVTLSNLFR
jgi:hypothetical protein